MRPQRDEHGAALIFAIATVVVIGALSASLFTPLLSGAQGRTILDTARDRQYAADGGIQFAIASVRAMPAPTTFSGAGFDACGPYSYSLNGDAINVVCEPNATPAINGFIQRDVVFTAYCVSSGCDASAPIIRAVVNFEAVGKGASYQVTHTYIRSWSVNG